MENEKLQGTRVKIQHTGTQDAAKAMLQEKFIAVSDCTNKDISKH